jgi:hypothetical protein
MFTYLCAVDTVKCATLHQVTFKERLLLASDDPAMQAVCRAL